MSDVSGPVTCCELSNIKLADLVGLGLPRPHSLVGSANRSSLDL